MKYRPMKHDFTYWP